MVPCTEKKMKKAHVLHAQNLSRLEGCTNRIPPLAPDDESSDSSSFPLFCTKLTLSSLSISLSPLGYLCDDRPLVPVSSTSSPSQLLAESVTLGKLNNVAVLGLLLSPNISRESTLCWPGRVIRGFTVGGALCTACSCV